MQIGVRAGFVWLMVAVFAVGCVSEDPTGNDGEAGFNVAETSNAEDDNGGNGENGDSGENGDDGEQCVEESEGGYVCPFGCRDDDRWPAEWRQRARRLVDEINETRAEGAECGGETMPPVGPVELDPQLVEAARCHAQDMGENEFFAHQGSDGSDEIERAEQAGYDSSYVGENLAKGHRRPRDVVDGWLESEGHCINLMHAEYRETGAAYVEIDGSTYWSQSYGRRF